VIGEGLYYKVGFQPTPSFEWRFPAVKLEQPLPGVKYLTKREIVDNWMQIFKPYESSEDYFTILTTPDHLDFYFFLENTFLETAKKKVHEIRGVQVGDSILVIELDMFVTPFALSLYYRFTDMQTAVILIKAAQSVACALSLERFSLWEDITQCNGNFDWKQLSNYGGERREREELIMIYPCKNKLNASMWKQRHKCMIL